MTRLRCDQAPAWAALQAYFDAEGKNLDLREAFVQDARRFENFSQDAPHVFADLSKNLIDGQSQALLMELARQCALESQRDAMFAGKPINSTENRAVMHFLLRHPPPVHYLPAQAAIDKLVSCQAPQAGSLQRQAYRHFALDATLADAQAEVEVTLHAMLAYAEQLRGDDAITDIVNIGIGGSDLGPQMAVLALAEFATKGKRFHFVSNVDGNELAGVLKGLKADSTLFLVASKTFTTTETMTNAHSARAWFEAQGGRDIGRHFAGLTTNVTAAKDFGISTTFGFWDWVGGRYSLWSAIGLPIAIAIGTAGFREFLAGAHAMDEHFRTTALEENLPVRLGLLDVWYRNFHGFGSRSIAPYSSALRRWPAYLQQLEMESNGKRVDRDGRRLPFETAPVLWGEPGTNGQHAYFQMLHQGTSVVPVEFVAVKKPAHAPDDLPGHHAKLLANALAQAQALMRGKEDAGGHRDFPGNRPSTFLLLEQLTASSLGALIALQEHRVFVSGAIWGINSFDQWGVELGKVLARDIEPRLESGDVSGLDGSTAGLLQRLR
ncbi:MAG: glucose-6-phosphate isomerase [Pseudomonadota bacterium]|nr:glucose-6-phosphate isomerase [Pseudomonadota bacterium]